MFEPGDKVKIKGLVKFGQDFSFWEWEFPDDLIFTIDDQFNGQYKMSAYGFGKHGDENAYDPKSYGNGCIFILTKYDTHFELVEKYVPPLVPSKPFNIHEDVLIP